MFGDGVESTMSLGIYPVFEPKLKGAKFDALGEALASNLEVLDTIARSAKLTLFTAFADNRPIPDEFDGDPDDLAEIMGEWTEWFDPADGQTAMQALAEHIKNNPKAAKALDASTDVVDELTKMARLLGVAVKQGVRFRFGMG
jgi:hypothetical protein